MLNKIKKINSVTHILILINAILFIIMIISDSKLSIDTLLTFGAKYNYAIVEGEYYRLFTTMFLHANLMHILFNMVALNAFGKDLEMIFGPKKFILLYLISGLIGSIGSFIFNSSIGVGASGAIFGLLGAHLYLFTINPKVYKRIYGKDMLVLIGFNLIYGFIAQNIDNSAHLFGLIGGYIVAWSLGIFNEKILSKKRIPFQILLISIPFIFSLLAVPSYKNSYKYNWDKGLDLISENKVFEAKKYFENGLSKKTNNENFIEILKIIEEYETELNK